MIGRRLLRQGIPAALIGLAVFYGLVFLPLPYYVFTPGLALSTRPMVHLSGTAAPEQGAFLLTTVRVGDVNAVTYVWSKLSGAQLVNKKDVLQKDETEKEHDGRLTTYMLTSQSEAIQAAYRKAGIPYRIDRHESKTGGGEGSGQTSDQPVELLEVKADREDRQLTINAGDIGGPSAGLMLALEAYNQLTPEDMTRGYRIAGTGEIMPDGEVGSIGGIRYKVRAAVREKADIFFAPKDERSSAEESITNYSDALDEAKKIGATMTIVPVGTMEEALRYLTSLQPKPDGR